MRLDAACEHAVVVDWGMACAIDARDSEGIAKGTPAYASPEQLTGHNPEQAWGMPGLCPAADVWALGSTLHTMIHGAPPFGGANLEELVANVMKLNYHVPTARPAASGGVSAEVGQLIGSMHQLLPSERATIADLCCHPWVQLGSQLPPPVAQQVSVVHGCGFLERADIDGFLAGGRKGSLGSHGVVRKMLGSALGLAPKQLGETHLAIAMDVPVGLTSPLGDWTRACTAWQATLAPVLHPCSALEVRATQKRPRSCLATPPCVLRLRRCAPEAAAGPPVRCLNRRYGGEMPARGERIRNPEPGRGDLIGLRTQPCI